MQILNCLTEPLKAQTHSPKPCFYEPRKRWSCTLNCTMDVINKIRPKRCGLYMSVCSPGVDVTVWFNFGHNYYFFPIIYTVDVNNNLDSTKRGVVIMWLTFHCLPITKYVASWGYSININPLPYHLPLLNLLFPSASLFHLKKHFDLWAHTAPFQSGMINTPHALQI